MQTTEFQVNTALRSPLYSEEAEQACLAAAFWSPKAAHQLVTLLAPADFQDPANRTVAFAIWHLVRKGKPASLPLVANLLKSHGKLEQVGPEYLAELDEAGGPAFGAHVEHYAKIVSDFATRRKFEEFGVLCQQRARDLELDAETLPSAATVDLLQLRGRAATGPRALSEYGDRELARLKSRQARPALLTGLAQVDRLSGGLEAGETGLIIGRPGRGKTVALMQLAEYAADHWGPGAFFALEMSGESVWDRLLCGVSGYSYREIRDAQRWDGYRQVPFTDGDLHELEAATKMIQRWTDKVHLGTDEHEIDRLIYAVQRLRLEHGIRWLMIDYGGLLTEPSGGKRGLAEEQTRIAKMVKNDIAKRLELPVWIGIQATPDVEKDGTKAKRGVAADQGKKIDRPIGMGDVSWAQQWVRDCSAAFALNPDPNADDQSPQQRAMLWSILKARNNSSEVSVPVWFRTSEFKFSEREFHQADPGPELDDDAERTWAQ